MTPQQTGASLACPQQLQKACHLLAYQHCRMYQSHLSARSPSPRQICCRTTPSQQASYRSCTYRHPEKTVDTLGMVVDLPTMCIAFTA